MKRLISIIAVLAMMLSMATVSFAAAIGSGESFSIVVNTQDVLEGSTDEFNVTVTVTANSTTNAANGFSNIDLLVNFDQTVIEVVDPRGWTLTGYTEEGSLLYGGAATNDGSNGVLRVAYQGATVGKALSSGAVFTIPFKLADGAAAGDTTTITVTGNAAVSTYNASEKPNLNWVTKANVANYVTAGSVSVISATPPAPPTPILVDGDATETSLDNADPKDNNIVVWGSITNSEYLTDDYEYGLEITDGANAGFYPALGLKEGKFGIKLIGNLVDASLASITRLYMYDGESYTYLD